MFCMSEFRRIDRVPDVGELQKGSSFFFFYSGTVFLTRRSGPLDWAPTKFQCRLQSSDLRRRSFVLYTVNTMLL